MFTVPKFVRSMAVVACLVTLIGASVDAQTYGTNLVVNGDAEANAIPNDKRGDPATGWLRWVGR